MNNNPVLTETRKRKTLSEKFFFFHVLSLQKISRKDKNSRKKIIVILEL